jgi:hypothetical protein
MRDHLYILAKPCSATFNDVELTDSIKEYIMNNRCYRETKPSKPASTPAPAPAPAPTIIHVDASSASPCASISLRVVAKCEYVYLIYVREFLMRNEPVYKIGKTTQVGLTRFGGYPKGSVLLYLQSCVDCTQAEREIMALFKSKYEQCTEYGTEYFRGDEMEMMCDMCAVVKRLSAVVEGECKAQITEK